MAQVMTNNIDKLLSSDPFEFSKKTSDLFIKSFKETSLHHYNNCDYIKYIWDQEKIHPSDINTEEDLTRAPFIMVNLFKSIEFMSCKKEDIELTLGSSGTTGQRSIMHLDHGSLERVKKLAYKIHESLGITSPKKYNYLCFTYDPKVANDLGTAFTDELLTSFTDQNEVYYTFQFDSNLNDFKMNEKEIVEKLIQFSKSEYPLRILGFPAFLYKIIKDNNLHLKLPEDSWLQTGGGWKSHAGDEIPKAEFREFIEKHLGIKKENIRDLFGMVEHGIPYVDNKLGFLTIPNYARVYIRDSKTLKILEHGKRGLIQFMCTYNHSYPAFNILSTDWGSLHKDETGQEFLQIEGRAGTTKHKGCALKALEIHKE